MQRNVFLPAASTGFQVLAQGTHLLPCDGPVQIRREQRFGLSALHGITSTSLPSEHTREPISIFASCSIGDCRPNRVPTSRTYARRRCLSASRPRVRRDFTVPRETSVISAISS